MYRVEYFINEESDVIATYEGFDFRHVYHMTLDDIKNMVETEKRNDYIRVEAHVYKDEKYFALMSAASLGLGEKSCVTMIRRNDEKATIIRPFNLNGINL